MLYPAQLFSVFVLVHFSFKILNVWYPFPQSIPGDSHHTWCRHMKDKGHVTYHPWHANTADKHQTRNHAQKSWLREETFCEQNQNTEATQVIQKLSYIKREPLKIYFPVRLHWPYPPTEKEGGKGQGEMTAKKLKQTTEWRAPAWFVLGQASYAAEILLV